MNELQKAFIGPLNYQHIEELIDQGADVNAKDSAGQTPLHYAVAYSNVYLVKLLVEKGAMINVRDDEGETPLDIATDPEIISFLEQKESRFAEQDSFVESPFFNKMEQEDECAICGELLGNGYSVCVNKSCQHGFHCDCINGWLQRSDKCPMCNTKFTSVFLHQFQQNIVQRFGKKGPLKSVLRDIAFLLKL
jgi:hypothetical protein